jgi:NDP-sugar pyrophosphorylase family protein
MSLSLLQNCTAMKAMIFAAGLGTRLRPYTNDRPKALVEINGVPLLEIAIQRLTAGGIEEIIVNVHHFASQIEAFLQEKRYFGIRIELSDEREQLLDTGGGLKKAAGFFDDDQPFFAYNADILTTLDLRAMYAAHQASDALATLAVRTRDSPRAFLFDDAGRLSGWRNLATQAERIVRPAVALHPMAFSGIHVINPGLFRHMPDKAVFSIVDVYLDVASREPIMAYPHDQDLWIDVGKPGALAEAQQVWR